MKSYVNLKWLTKLGTWVYDNKEITFTNMELWFDEEGSKYLAVTLSVYDTYSATSDIIENIPVYPFEDSWTKLEEIQMTEVIVDYLILGFENMKELGLGYKYEEFIKDTKYYL